MSKIDKLVDNKVVQNLFVWLFLFLVLAASIQGTQNRFLSAFIAIVILGTTIYIQNLLILPLLKKARVNFGVLTLVNAIIFALLITITLQYSVSKSAFDWGVFSTFFGVILLSLFLGSALKIARDSFYRRQQEKNAELKLLKAQLNPHFLFNTLNNLYGLSVIKSDKLPNLMLKLSDLLRYSLYDTKEVFVPIEKEISYLENYISLEKIRLEETEISFLKEGDFSVKTIAPMLLIVFVENAFKHLGGENSSVKINIKLQKGTLHFLCKNSIDENVSLERNLEEGKSGIGMKNAEKRLELLYPNKHNLIIEKEKGFFSVNLTIKE